MTRQALAPLVGGAVLGMTAVVPAASVLAGEPFYVRPLDPPVYVVSLLVLLASGTAAALIPALRALGADPLSALRQD